MKFQGALVKEQGVAFGLVVVKSHVLHNPMEADSVRRFGEQVFGAIPIVLMAQNSKGVPTYSGRRDIVKFLANVPVQVIPWREYTVA